MMTPLSDGCGGDACADETGEAILLVEPYRWEDTETGGRGYYRCPKCLWSWHTAWSDWFEGAW